MLFKTTIATLLIFATYSDSQGAGQYVDEYSDYSTGGLPGRLYEPPTASTEGEKLPLVLALHGGGGIGTNNVSNVWDFDELFLSVQKHNAFIYAPQAISAFWHIEGRHQNIMTMIDRLIIEKNIDANRIYITGFSMGGGGTWDLLKLYPNRFAAAIPICGIAPRVNSDYSDIAGKSIWASHARNDPSVTYQDSRTVIDSILDAVQSPRPNYTDSGLFEFENTAHSLRYTEYATGGHSIWPTVYSDQEMIDWLLNQTNFLSNGSPQILDTEMLFGPKFAITFRAHPGSVVDIEQSPNLSDWTLFATLINETETFTYTTDETEYFYRIKQYSPGD